MVTVLKQWWEQSTSTLRGRLLIVGMIVAVIGICTWLNYVTWASALGWSGWIAALIIAVVVLGGTALGITLLAMLIIWVRGRDGS